MSALLVPIQALCDDLALPQYATAGSAGMDVRACIDAPLLLRPGSRVLVPCGFALALPQGLEAQIRPRSGLAFKHGVTVLNAPGTIDADYRGEVAVILWNAGEQDFCLQRGDRIAQMVVAAVTVVQWLPVATLSDTSRGTGGFGSTG